MKAIAELNQKLYGLLTQGSDSHICGWHPPHQPDALELSLLNG